MVGDTAGNGETESTGGVVSGRTPGSPVLTQMKIDGPENSEEHTAREFKGSVTERLG